MLTPEQTTPTPAGTTRTRPATKKAATAPKGAPTPKRSAAAPKAGGVKPQFAVVEHALKCQSWDGEVSLDLRIPLGNFEKLSQLEDMPESESLAFITKEIMPADVSDAIYGLRDSAQALEFTMKWIEAVGERFGASLGESGGSSAS